MNKPLEDFDPVGCTCPMTEIEVAPGITRFVVMKHTCPHCREWMQRMGDLGVSEKRHVDPDARQKKFKVRKAA